MSNSIPNNSATAPHAFFLFIMESFSKCVPDRRIAHICEFLICSCFPQVLTRNHQDNKLWTKRNLSKSS